MRTINHRGAVVAVALGFVLASAAWSAGGTGTSLSTLTAGSEETTFGDLATDALCSVANTTVALAPAVIFKPGEIQPGPVTQSAVEGLLYDPAEKWAVLELTGTQLRAALERSVSFAPTPRAFFLQVSGLSLVYGPQAARGRRIKSINVGFQALQDSAKYEVAMPQSLAEGGTGYFTIFGDAPVVRSGAQSIADVITGYVQSKGTVSYTGQGRIVVGG